MPLHHFNIPPTQAETQAEKPPVPAKVATTRKRKAKPDAPKQDNPSVGEEGNS